jgi:orotate phosphoribosyltransferase
MHRGTSRASEREGLPFLYVRSEAKDHGLRKRIEGDPKPGQKVLLLDYRKGESYFDDAWTALRLSGLLIDGGFSALAKDVRKTRLRGRRGIVIEDLISTGGSSIKEVAAYRKLGARIPACVSIFDYGLDEAARGFAGLDPACAVRSALGYDALIARARETARIDGKSEALLREWRADPFGWGETHGFPRVEKK